MNILHRRQADDGATLIIVLLFTTVIALVIGVVLTQADTSIRSTMASRDQAGAIYNADGAAQAAINAIRNNTFNNDTTSGTFPKCFGAGANDDTLVLPNFYPATRGLDAQTGGSAAVTCKADPDTGAGGSLVPITDSNKPGNAILTLGTNAGEDGINVKPLNNGVFRVHGTVVSDSNINVTNGSLDSNAGVFAHTGCSGTITSVPAAACNAASVADPNYSFEPAFASPANQVPPYQAVPSISSCTNGVLAFNPGYYDDAAALNALTTSNGCGVWWFRPGTYYFDFHNNNSDPSVNAALTSTGNGGAADQWLVSRGTLVAGTPVNAAGTVLSAPPASPTVPGSCQNPIKTTAAVGVQFIFGGDSQLVISGSGGNAANAEICGSYSATRPPIAMYGIKSGADSLTNPGVLKMTGSPAQTTNFTNLGRITDTDNSSASWIKAGASTQTQTATVTGYSPSTAIPAGSIVKSARLTVVHGNTPGYVTSGGNKTALSVTMTPKSGATTGPVFTLTPSIQAGGGLQTDTFDLYGSGNSLFDQWVHSTGFSGADMAYSATLKHASTENIDSIQLQLTYIAPAFRAQTASTIPGNCVAATYTGGGGGQCAVLSTSGSYAGAFYVQGTTYLPFGVVDITLNNITQQVLRFGVIARSLWVKETGSLDYSGPVIEVPDNSVGYGPGGTVVYLTVYVCPAAATCAATGTPKLRAKVLIRDQSLPPSAGHRRITILSWSVH